MKLVDKYKNNFEYIIKQRGKTYYEEGKVVNLIKNEETDEYTAEVIGTENNIYQVKLNLSEHDEEYGMFCTCPYPDNCKHIFATLLSIDDKSYKSVKLLPNIPSKEYDFEDIIKNISEQEIKECFVSIVKYFDSNLKKQIKNQLFKHFPNNEYEYYYNKLYNNLITNSGSKYLLEEYSKEMKVYLELNNYNQVFIILKAILDSMSNFNNLFETNYAIKYLSEISVYTRIAYRQADIGLKNEINKYANDILKKEKLNIYIEDFITNNIIFYKGK